MNRHRTDKLPREQVAAMACDGKARFDSYSRAEAVIRARNTGRNGQKNRTVYRCKVCHGFHIGSQA